MVKIRELRSRIVALRAVIEIEEEIGIRPFEVERLDESAAHADILEERTPCIERKAGRRRRGPLRDRLADDLALRDRGKVVAG